MTSRRNFIKTTSALATGATLAGFSFPSMPGELLTFDLHSHPGAFFSKGSPEFAGDAAIAKTIGEMKSGKLSGAFFSLVADAQLIKLGPEGVRVTGNYAAGDAWMDYKRQLSTLKEIISGNKNLSLATKGKMLDESAARGQTAAFIGCEGGDYLEGDAGRLEEMYADGVRSLQLVHYHVSELGDLQTADPQHNGLSAAGREVVKRMNKLGMVIDVAHASFETTRHVASLTTAPIILSHSMLRVESDHPIVKRTISREHAKVVAETGGVIGMWPCGLNKSFEDFVDNTLKLIDAVGVDHVGLGTDMDGNFKPVFSSYLQLQPWADALRRKGLSREEAGKVAGGNVKRVLEKVLDRN